VTGLLNLNLFVDSLKSASKHGVGVIRGELLVKYQKYLTK
jgi:hypothetical protein